jgi:RNA recognition motif-containing protein
MKYMAQVQFLTPEEADAAIAELHRSTFAGQIISVKWARNQPEGPHKSIEDGEAGEVDE